VVEEGFQYSFNTDPLEAKRKRTVGKQVLLTSHTMLKGIF